MSPAQLVRQIMEQSKRPRKRPRIGEIVRLCKEHGVRLRAGSSTARITFYFCPVCRALGRSKQLKVSRPE